MQGRRTVTDVAYGVLLLAAVLSTSVVWAEEGFFFGGREPDKPMAAYTGPERDRLLSDAYACNRADRPSPDGRPCTDRHRQAREIIAERIRLNHRRAAPALEGARRLRSSQP
jgi:hypothetical protein